MYSFQGNPTELKPCPLATSGCLRPWRGRGGHSTASPAAAALCGTLRRRGCRFVTPLAVPHLPAPVFKLVQL